MTVRMVELFAGIGAQATAMENLGIDFTSTVSEIDQRAYKVYCAIHGPTENLGDITKIEHLPPCDLITYSFPCIRGDQPVRTSKGNVQMKDLKVGDEVLTHRGRFRKITDFRMTGIHGTISLETPMGKVVCTKDHMVYTKFRLKSNCHKREDGRTGRTFTKPYWSPAIALTKDNYLGCPVNTKSEIPKWSGVDYNRYNQSGSKNQLEELMGSSDFWKICGMFVGDGWVRESNYSVIICCEKNEKERNEKASILDKIGGFTCYEERTVYKFVRNDKELASFMLQFGKGAGNKFLPQFVLDLPVELLKSFIEGYLSTDGHYDKRTNEYSISSISPTLMYDMVSAIAKAYHRPSCVYFTKRPETTEIEGRIVNQKDTWMIKWHTDDRIQDKLFYEDGIIWSPIKNKEILNPTMVYDISVEEDESFVVGNITVHNCQDLSIAGKRAGMEEGSGTRSSLLWEVGRLLDDLASRNELPEHLVMENVDAILNEKNRPFYEEWKRRLDELGYITTDGILNAKDFGVPQNRKRCFAVSVLKRSKGGKIGMAYVMPKGRPLELRLKDMLESNVPESYYLSQERIANYERHRLRQEANGRGFGWKPMIPEESVAHTFTGNQTRNTGNFIVDKSQTKLELTDAKGEPLSIQSKQSEQKVQPEYNRLPDEKYDIEARVYDTGKLSPALRTKSFNVKIEEDRE